MNLSFITRTYGAAKLALSAKAPTLMVVGGVATMTAGTVLACRQTLTIETVLANHTEDLEKIETGLDLELESYNSDLARADRIKVYARAGLDLGKHYAVPAVLFLGGVGLVFGGHRIMLKRNATLALAFTGLKKAFDSYRGNVVNALGEEYDQKFLRGEVPDNQFDDAGELLPRKFNESTTDPYNRVFEQGASESWRPDLGANVMFLSTQQRYAQERLNRRGYLYLSEVYEALGFPESDISRVVGWKVRRNPDGTRDIPAVDFGINTPHPSDDVYKVQRAVYLDFNCQGLIIGGKLQRILEQA